MPESTSNLLQELIDKLLYITEETEEWKELLKEPITDPHAIPGWLGRITRAGIEAGVSEELAISVVQRYAASENVTLSKEKIESIVRGCYEVVRMKKKTPNAS